VCQCKLREILKEIRDETLEREIGKDEGRWEK